METTRKLTGRYIGRCRNCKVVIVREDPFPVYGTMTTTCACGYRASVKPVVGRVTEHKCGTKCTSALGPSCDCTCGGERHGADHV